MKLLLRSLRVLTYPFLVLSALAPAGLAFGAAFVDEFAVENRSDQTLLITPVGAVGPQGVRAPLPVKLWRFPPMPARQLGRFRVDPGGSVRILYDMDDINFSEIVVEDEQGQIRQLVTDATPTQNRYHGPLQSCYTIRELEVLGDVPAAVLPAFDRAQRPSRWPLVLVGLLTGPWLVHAGLSALLARYDRPNKPL